VLASQVNITYQTPWEAWCDWWGWEWWSCKANAWSDEIEDKKFVENTLRKKYKRAWLDWAKPNSISKFKKIEEETKTINKSANSSYTRAVRLWKELQWLNKRRKKEEKTNQSLSEKIRANEMNCFWKQSQKMQHFSESQRFASEKTHSAMQYLNQLPDKY
jgi:hypothetical protein